MYFQLAKWCTCAVMVISTSSPGIWYFGYHPRINICYGLFVLLLSLKLYMSPWIWEAICNFSKMSLWLIGITVLMASCNRDVSTLFEKITFYAWQYSCASYLVYNLVEFILLFLSLLTIPGLYFSLNFSSPKAACFLRRLPFVSTLEVFCSLNIYSKRILSSLLLFIQMPNTKTGFCLFHFLPGDLVVICNNFCLGGNVGAYKI